MTESVEIAPGVYQLRLPMLAPPVVYEPDATVSVYLLRGRDGALLIDSGWNTEICRNSLSRQLAEMGIGWGDLKQVVYTHLHSDHFGFSGMFEGYGITRQAAHWRDVEHAHRRYDISGEDCWQQESLWLQSHGTPAEQAAALREVALTLDRIAWPAMPEMPLEGGEIIEFPPFQLQVLWTPGHSPGHICLYEPRLKVLFAGDHLVERGAAPVAFFNSYDEDHDPVAHYVDSVKSLMGLDVALVLPAHGRPFGGLPSRAREIVSQVERMQAMVLSVLDEQRSLTAFEVTVRIHDGDWNETLPVMKRAHILFAVARLQALRLEGRVEAIMNDGVVSFLRRSAEPKGLHQ